LDRDCTRCRFRNCRSNQVEMVERYLFLTLCWILSPLCKRGRRESKYPHSPCRSPSLIPVELTDLFRTFPPLSSYLATEISSDLYGRDVENDLGEDFEPLHQILHFERSSENRNHEKDLLTSSTGIKVHVRSSCLSLLHLSLELT